MTTTIIGFLGGVIGSIVGSWITLSFNKFNSLKKSYKEHAISFAKLYPEAKPPIKDAICNNEKTYKLLITGQTVDEEVLNFENTWFQMIKCFIKPF